MSSTAIGGPLEGARLAELPVGEKTTWHRWRSHHPNTLVLSVEGQEHVESNPYDNYFSSDGTFRGLEVADTRLEPKTPVFAFWLGAVPWAIPLERVEGGVVVAVGPEQVPLALWRPVGAPIFESTRAWSLTADADSEDVLARVRQGTAPEGAELVSGFDTFWYTWVGVNPRSELIP